MRFAAMELEKPPDTLPVTVEGFIEQARLNGLTVARQPNLIERELAAATLRAEQYLRRSLITQTLRGLFVPDGLDCACGLNLALPRGRVQSVESITSGSTEVDPATYTLNWNVVTLQSPLLGAATVIWVSGYGDDAAAVPDLIIEGIYRYATELYDNRSGVSDQKYEAQASATLAQGIVGCWRPYQVELSG